MMLVCKFKALYLLNLNEEDFPNKLKTGVTSEIHANVDAKHI